MTSMPVSVLPLQDDPVPDHAYNHPGHILMWKFSRCSTLLVSEQAKRMCADVLGTTSPVLQLTQLRLLVAAADHPGFQAGFAQTIWTQCWQRRFPE